MASTNFYRLDNTLKYTANAGPWQARAAYSFGEVPGDATASSSHAVALAYQRTTRDDGFDHGFLFVEKTLAPRTTAYAEADYTVWRGTAGDSPHPPS